MLRANHPDLLLLLRRTMHEKLWSPQVRGEVARPTPNAIMRPLT